MQLPAPSRDYSMSLSEVTLSSHRRVSRKRCSHGTLSGKQKPTHGTLSGVAYMRSSHIRRWSTNSWPCVQGALARACLQAGIHPGFFAPTQEMSCSFAPTQDMSCPFLCLYLCSGTRSCFIDSYIESNKFPLGGEPYVVFVSTLVVSQIYTCSVISVHL